MNKNEQELNKKLIKQSYKSECNEQMKKTNKNTNLGMVMGMCFGMCIGTSLGSVLGNTGMGTSLGMCIGLMLGLVIGSQKDKKVNEQLETQNYTVKVIEQNKDYDEYSITIVSSSGKETIVTVPKGQMETELFCVGDIVFLDDDGLIEQAYDKEDEQ